jgi:uncharacterized protein involved in type VI secretion and phage assembly
VSTIIGTLRALVREELATQRGCELGIVTRVYTNAGGSGDHNLEVDVRIRGSATELQRVPLAVTRSGVSFVPREGDLMLLAFVGGDLNAPIALGFLYDEQTRPPDASSDEVVYRIPEDAKDDARRIEIVLPNGNKLTLQDKKLSVVMGSSKLTVEGDGAITLEAGGDLNLKASGDVKIEATGAASLKGASVSVEGQGDAKLKGATTTISGNTSFSPT